MFNKKSLLITGGTGSLGNAIVSRILSKYPAIKRLVIFSRDEMSDRVKNHESIHWEQYKETLIFGFLFC